MIVPALIRLKRYLTVILRWLLITFTVFVLTFLGGNYITDNFLFKICTASAGLQVPPSDLLIPAGGTVTFRPEFENIIRSPAFLLPVIMDLDLDKAWAKRASKSQEGQLSPQDALAHMNQILKLDCVSGTSVITITASSDVPKEAADIANAIADRYKSMREFEEDQRSTGGLKQEHSVRILTRAQIPPIPDKSFAYLVTILVAGFLSLMAASFVEMIFLFLRASTRTNN
jgi:capsular polysaccharide biosynthesis protein